MFQVTLVMRYNRECQTMKDKLIIFWGQIVKGQGHRENKYNKISILGGIGYHSYEPLVETSQIYRRRHIENVNVSSRSLKIAEKFLNQISIKFIAHCLNRMADLVLPITATHTCHIARAGSTIVPLLQLLEFVSYVSPGASERIMRCSDKEKYI